MDRTKRRQAARSLILMVKEPRVGAVKTRLADDIGAVAAAHFYRTVTGVLIRRLAFDRRWRTVLGVTPDNAVASPFWPKGILRVPQRQGDIGERMERLLHSQGLGPVILIGSDIPGVCAAHIGHAFSQLDRHDAVLGAAEDGGFWLIGMKPLPRLRGLFRGVRWSSDRSLADTLANLNRQQIGFAARLDDVDNGEAFRRVAQIGTLITSLKQSSD